MLLTSVSNAQDPQQTFADFLGKAAKDFQDFNQSAHQSFFDALAGMWTEFRVFSGYEVPSRPGPKDIPVAPEDAKPETEEIPTAPAPVPEPAQTPVPAPEPVPTPAPEQKPVPTPAPVTTPASPAPAIPLSKISFYGIEIPIPARQDFASGMPSLPKDFKSPDIVAFWKDLEEGGASTVMNGKIIPALAKIASDNDLSEWTFFKLVQAFSKTYWTNSSEQAIVCTSVMNRFGFDVRLANVGNRLTVMIPARQTIYGHPYIEVDGKPFYLVDKEPVEELRTCSEPYSDKQVAVDMDLLGSDLIFRQAPSHTVSKEMKSFGGTLTLPLEDARLYFYQDYPLVDIACYSHEVADPAFLEALMAQLAPLKDLDQIAAVRYILHAIQRDFDYATDREQFGHEKPFFVAENFVYPKNDCEDRAILMSFLVRNLIGLDAVLLEYPEHLAMAVEFPEEAKVPGAYVYSEGKKYVVCDPTYIGADIGMVMPCYKDVEAKVLK